MINGLGNMSPTTTSLALLWNLCHCLTAAYALTGGWVETDPTWVTPDDWETEDGVRHLAGYVLDGNMRTGWQRAAEEDTWRLTFDLQTPVTLSRIHMWYYHTRDVTVLCSMSLVKRFETVKQAPAPQHSGAVTDGEIHMSEVDLSGFLATGQFWRLQFSSIFLKPFEIMEVKFFQACSGLEKKVCSDGDCDVYDVICDGIVDCVDGSDEENCDEETCSNGAIVSKSQVCDGTDDCGDNTDEQHCCERKDKMACNDGQCREFRKECKDDSRVSCGHLTHLYSRCDETEDCSDGSDEYCHCYYLSDKGTSYRGRADRNRSCQFWTSQYPHAHNHTPEAYPSAGLELNYCRNPDGKDRPWCYTNNPLVRWRYCDDVFACDGKIGAQFLFRQT
ncbi:PREDICTED: low-density lipoprotein receptor-related protein 2-like [Branchiostoma belcheri]|uniref:Low-density lipoprotein receptor-related protein 2-like n=1 Tax=Branchiostoma belcheri TaxID=7741 RepID=A0A6P4YU24_BRABE|nr:PREDICTED: low-density lipoprotein receptor-related protein 2-like [Branchiostoma belcheri]